jgi:hypothetical protein
MTRRKMDPRDSVHYVLINNVITFLDMNGPATLDEICTAIQEPAHNFRQARYSLPGRLAMEDRNVVIPRPVSDEGFLYKLADAWGPTGPGTGEPNVKKAVSDILTRLAVTFEDIDNLTQKVPGKTSIGKSLRKLKRSMNTSLDQAEEVATLSKTDISDRAAYILENRP